MRDQGIELVSIAGRQVGTVQYVGPWLGVDASRSWYAESNEGWHDRFPSRAAAVAAVKEWAGRAQRPAQLVPSALAGGSDQAAGAFVGAALGALFGTLAGSDHPRDDQADALREQNQALREQNEALKELLRQMQGQGGALARRRR